ncbi:hypothetical protein HL42_1437 [Trichophyton rubrum]|nr:hypothetical protein HL42_1437 [Trichophyton rubrum]
MPHATENSSAPPPSSSFIGTTSSSSSSGSSIDSDALQQFVQQHARDDHWSAYTMRGNHELVVCICLFAPLGSYQTVVTVLHYAGQPLPGASTAVPVLALTWELRWCHRSHGWESPFSFTPSTHPSRWAACIPKQANDCKNPH